MSSERVDWECELEEDRRQTETFRRLHRLYKRGFRPDWTVTDVEDAIWWKHPGGHPELILYPDGKVVASLGRAVLNSEDKHDKDRIYNTSEADNSLFNNWLASVKTPTWWQAGAEARERYIIMPLVMLFFLAVAFLIAWGAEKVLKAIWSGVAG